MRPFPLALAHAALSAAAAALTGSAASAQPRAARAVPRVEAQTSGTTASLRGISAASAQVVWASGSRGTWLRTVDGGATWLAGTVPGAEASDFRDVHAVDARTAYLLGVQKPAVIYRTADAGRTWTRQFADSTPEAFLDCLAFWDRDHGIALGDPMGGRFLVLVTANGGAAWTRVPAGRLPALLDREAAFAASGTCVAAAGGTHAWFGTGLGGTARVHHTPDRGRTWTVAEVPIPAAGASSGIFTVAFRTPRHGAAAGGDYQQPTAGAPVALTTDGGATWRPAAGPGFYVSGLAWGPASSLVAVGTAGMAWSGDGAKHWTRVDTLSLNAVTVVGRTGWAVGDRGRIVRLRWGAADR